MKDLQVQTTNLEYQHSLEIESIKDDQEYQMQTLRGELESALLKVDSLSATVDELTSDREGLVDKME